MTALSWRDSILVHFPPTCSRLTLVTDPDALFAEEKLALELRDRGFDVLEFQDTIAFRYAYESVYRAAWDAGKDVSLIVLLRVPEVLPYDFLTAGRHCSFTLGELFPLLSYPVLAELDRSLLDALFAAQQKFVRERLGDNASKDFILRHVFGIESALIKNDVDLLRTLLRLHYGQLPLPAVLAARLVTVLNDDFPDWPLERIVPDSAAFFPYLQQAWPAFVQSQTQEGVQTARSAVLPFGHQDIRVYIDNCFADGKLTPIACDENVSADVWMRCGLEPHHDENAAQARQKHLAALLADSLPAVDAGYGEWLSFACKWAELTALFHTNPTPENTIAAIYARVQQAFPHWLQRHFAGLINQPPGRPVLVHHIPRFLARRREAGSLRQALLVIDGLALDQWVTVRQELNTQANLLLREDALFAWLPTLTSVSRQALFAGKAPLYFPNSIGTTNAEEALWKQFWEDSGISRAGIAYARRLGTGDADAALETVLHPHNTQVIGLVIDTVDRIMHGMQLGAAGMHNQIRQWCGLGFLRDVLHVLLDADFEVWLTSDHGNIACQGVGRPVDGVLAETRGERVRVYPTPELRASASRPLPHTLQWTPVGLPPEYCPLFAQHEAAFCLEGTQLVGHGGIALEEVIIPFVKIEKRTHS